MSNLPVVATEAQRADADLAAWVAAVESTGEPMPVDRVEAQISETIKLGREDRSNAPRWGFRDLDGLVGPLMPGELWVVGALPSNGKTALMMSQMTKWAERHIPVLYLPLEIDPEDMRRRWAAWELGLNPTHVYRGEWRHLPPGSRERWEAAVQAQWDRPIHFVADQTVTLDRLARLVEWGRLTFEVEVVVIDHFHRLDFGGGEQHRLAVNKAVRGVKNLARDHGISVVTTAQLNGDADPLDRYFPPTLRRLKESASIGEEADVVLMLSRRLSGIVSREDLELIKIGKKSPRDLADPGCMMVMCRKHRHDDANAGDRSVLLHVENGRVTDRAPSWMTQPQHAQPWSDE